MRGRRAAFALTVLAVLLTATSAAETAIVAQRGIGGAELRMTKAQVRARLGQPLRVKTGRNEFGRYTNFVYARVTVMFQSGSRVTGLRTTSRLERTASGVGVGSTQAQIKARIAGSRCRTEFGARHCFVGKFLPGHIVTDFQIRNGRVSSVVVGFVLD